MNLADRKWLDNLIKENKNSNNENIYTQIPFRILYSLQQENDILRKQSLRKRKEDYSIYEINEIMYYCDEFAYVTVIMVDNNIIRFDDLDKFIDWYLSLRKKRKNSDECYI